MFVTKWVVITGIIHVCKGKSTKAGMYSAATGMFVITKGPTVNVVIVRAPHPLIITIRKSRKIADDTLLVETLSELRYFKDIIKEFMMTILNAVRIKLATSRVTM